MAYTVLDSKNIDKKKNIYTFGGSGTKPERDDIAENSKLIDYSSGEKFYYDPSKAAGSKWQPDKEPSGGSGGGSLPANFPAEAVANANKFLGFDANGDYAAKDAPSGGAETITVAFTYDDQEDEWSANKTVSEISAAKTAGKEIVAAIELDDVDYKIPFASMYHDSKEDEDVISFSGTIASGEEPMVATICGNDSHWNVSYYTPANEVDMYNRYEPFIVTLTETEESDAIVRTADKSLAQIIAAKEARRPVVCRYEPLVDEGGLALTYDIPCAYAETIEIQEGVSGSAAQFAGTVSIDGEHANSIIITVYEDDGSDVWSLDIESLEKELPEINSSVYGKFLRVDSSGHSVWDATSIIVTFTESSGTYTGNATYSQVLAAYKAGKNIVLNPANLTLTVMGAVDLTNESANEIYLYVLDVIAIAQGSGSYITALSGAPNDNVSISAS